MDPEDECRNGGNHHGKQDNEGNVAHLDELKKTIERKMALRKSNVNPERPGGYHRMNFKWQEQRNDLSQHKPILCGPCNKPTVLLASLVMGYTAGSFIMFMTLPVSLTCANKATNLNAFWHAFSNADSGFLRRLDSSIKRNTAVIKKLKQTNEEQREAMIQELKNVNLSKFLGEAVTAICDANPKTSDVEALVQICLLLHQRYKDFSPSLIEGLLKVFPAKSGDDLDADRNLKAMKKRNTLKLLMELYFVGVVEDVGIFVNIIKDLTGSEHLKDRDTTQTNLSILANFARQGRIFLGLPHFGQEIFEEFSKVLNITEDRKKIFRKEFYTYYDNVLEILKSEHTALRQLEHEKPTILNAKREFSEENLTSYEKLQKSYDHLFRGVASLAKALEMQPPVMAEDVHTTMVTSGHDASSSSAGKESSVPVPIWDDEDTRAFYECLPDLRAFVPALFLGEAEPKCTGQFSKTQEQPYEPVSESNQDAEEGSVDCEASEDEKLDEKGEEIEFKDKEKTKESVNENGQEKDVERKGESEKEKSRGLDGKSLDALLQRLPGCLSYDLIDQLTVEFCYLNSKYNRKRLVRTLYNVSKSKLELLPFYSRMVATLSTCMKDISCMLLKKLEIGFDDLIKRKGRMKIETRIKNVRYLGELCKFKIAPARLVFTCLKACFDDFTHQNIDVACNLFETCGRFLYRSPETTTQMANMLEILLRFKNVKNLDPHHDTLVEQAYYLCKQPERLVRVSKVRPPLHQYIRKLLFVDLDNSSIEHVLRQLLKLPWSECESYLIKCFTKVHRVKFSEVHLIASLTAGLSRYHDDFAVAVVDELLEEIRLGLEELNELQQSRIAHMHFLGELYKHECVDSSCIFETLYLTLVCGHWTPRQEFLDPAEDCFRIRMIIIFLQTCGHCLDRGSSKKKLDTFLVYFQRYILSKGSVPLEIEFDLQDLFTDLRPNMPRYSSIEDVDVAIMELEEHEHASLGENESDSGSSRINMEGHADEQDLCKDKSENECEYGADAEYAGSDEDDELHVRQKVVEVDPQEEAEFDKELRALMQLSLDSRKLDLRARPSVNMMVPMNVFEGPTKGYHVKGEGESGDDILDEDGGIENKEVCVKLLVKRGNKHQTKQMFIPYDSSLVQSTKEKVAAQLEEKQNIKRLILEYNEKNNEKEAEDELNEVSTQLSDWIETGGSLVDQASKWNGTVGRTSGARHWKHGYISGGSSFYHAKRR